MGDHGESKGFTFRHKNIEEGVTYLGMFSDWYEDSDGEPDGPLAVHVNVLHSGVTVKGVDRGSTTPTPAGLDPRNL